MKPATDEHGGFACNGCGACCEDFFIGKSPEVFRQEYLSWREQKSYDADKISQDIFLIYPMLILLRTDYKLSGGEVVAYSWYYTCKHFDKETRRCTIHEIRPQMCYQFPFYGADRPVAGKCYPSCQFHKLP